ncbi:MAG: DUF4173 domain-containing protein [Eubacteriales bacterium]
MVKLNAEKREIWLLAGSLSALTLLFFMMMAGGLAAGFAVVWILLVGAAVWYVKGAPGWCNPLSARLCLLASVLFTPVYAITAHMGVRVLLFLLQGTALILWVAFATGNGGTGGRMGELLSAAMAALSALFVGFCELGEGLSQYFGQRRCQSAEDVPHRRRFPWGILAGVLLALPAIVILLPILTSADAAFDGMVESAERVLESVVHTVFDGSADFFCALGLALLLFFPISGMLFRQRRAPSCRYLAFTGILPGNLLTGFYGAITLICLAYLLAQLSYLFNGFLGIIPETMTAAEYARRGFFELFAFAMLTLVLIGAGVALAKKDGLSAVCNGLLIFLCGFNLLLIATALAKMVLYVRLYGLTPKRLTASVIMLFWAVLFVMLILGRILKGFRSLPVVLIAAIVLVGAVAYGDPDRITAEYNVRAWEAGNLSTVDMELLRNLSDAAIPALVRVYESDDPEVSAVAKRELRAIYLDKCSEYGIAAGSKLPTLETVFGYNLSEHMANAAINGVVANLMEGTHP